MAESPPMPENRTCVMCPRRGEKVCSGCKTARYCSKDCQKLDHKNHKIFCGKAETLRPSKDHFRALFFPGGDALPRFEWILDPNYALPNLFGDRGIDVRKFKHNTIQARDIGIDDPPNLAMRAFTRGGTAAWNTRGPWLIFHYVEDGKEGDDSYIDMNMHDVRSAADVITVIYDDLPQGPGNLDKDLKPPVQVARNGCDILFALEGSGIANLLGLPMFVRPMGFQSTLKQAGRNSKGALLMTDITSEAVTDFVLKKPGGVPVMTTEGVRAMMCGEQEDHQGSYGFGTPPASFCSDEVGPVLICRADNKPLLTGHIEALCDYIKVVIDPQVQAAKQRLNVGEVIQNREEILTGITKANFLAHWEKFKEDKIKAQASEAHPEWTPKYPSPYEMMGKTLESVNRFTETIYSKQIEGGMKQDSEMPDKANTSALRAQLYIARGPHGL
ncbi:uncharacterized protein AB675_10070 [Cyphellophora attinorum]|uniref:MYND-type domain-containing protein n=1 Tax=Cyphellophora attinorum TaxID=1664694 RepID=A0A0N1H418_9EURO|nr:uncharacterized protein AB675_10070 [Phialophora attinorum]KPI36624.1 hypothetical protein AB675_10070 [Phialophora attinorum]